MSEGVMHFDAFLIHTVASARCLGYTEHRETVKNDLE